MRPRDSSLKGHGPSHSPGCKLQAATSSSRSTALHQAICRARRWESRCPGHICGHLYAWATSAGMPGWWRKWRVSQQGGTGHKREVVGGTVGRQADRIAHRPSGSRTPHCSSLSGAGPHGRHMGTEPIWQALAWTWVSFKPSRGQGRSPSHPDVLPVP